MINKVIKLMLNSKCQRSPWVLIGEIKQFVNGNINDNDAFVLIKKVLEVLFPKLTIDLVHDTVSNAS